MLPTDSPDSSARGTVILPGTRSPLDEERSLRARRPGLSRERVRHAQRGRLLDAGVQLAVDGGYEATTIQAICRKAGVAYNTFYEHFGSKEALFLAAYEEGSRTTLAAVAAFYANGDTVWEDRIRASIQCCLRILVDNPYFVHFFAFEAPKLGRSLVNELAATYTLAPTVLSDAILTPMVSPEMTDVITMVMGGVSAVIFTYFQTGRRERVLQLEDTLVAFALAVFSALNPGQSSLPSTEHSLSESFPNGK